MSNFNVLKWGEGYFGTLSRLPKGGQRRRKVTPYGLIDNGGEPRG